MSDNFKFDIRGASLEKSLGIATTHYTEVAAWRTEFDPPRLVLYWTESSEANPLPAPLTGEALVLFVKSWLNSVDYGPEPDIDGECGRGSWVYNESWASVGGDWKAFVAIQPYWLMYGK